MFCLHKYYVLNAMYCIFVAPTSRPGGGGQSPSADPGKANYVESCQCHDVRYV